MSCFPIGLLVGSISSSVGETRGFEVNYPATIFYHIFSKDLKIKDSVPKKDLFLLQILMLTNSNYSINNFKSIGEIIYVEKIS